VGDATGKRIVDIVGQRLQLPLPVTVVKSKVDSILSDFFTNPDPAEAVVRNMILMTIAMLHWE
jgi:hypothetical protein